jgi:hypothetical protein
MTIVEASGIGMPTSYTKQKIAESMYRKGKSFVLAGLLLRREAGYEYVVLHLLCQGIEIILKSLLLHKDYDKYLPIIKKSIGHDIIKASNAVIAAYHRRRLSLEIHAELDQLNNLYKQHRLRYASGYDILVDPHTISSAKVIRKIVRVVKLIDQYISW